MTKLSKNIFIAVGVITGLYGAYYAGTVRLFGSSANIPPVVFTSVKNARMGVPLSPSVHQKQRRTTPVSNDQAPRLQEEVEPTFQNNTNVQQAPTQLTRLPEFEELLQRSDLTTEQRIGLIRAYDGNLGAQTQIVRMVGEHQHNVFHGNTVNNTISGDPSDNDVSPPGQPDGTVSEEVPSEDTGEAIPESSFAKDEHGNDLPADPYQALRDRGDPVVPHNSEVYLSQVVTLSPSN